MTTLVKLGERAPAPSLTASEARTLTDEVNADAHALREKCLRLYEGEAHTALGYPSWAAYWEAEIGGGKSDAYRSLNAARVNRLLPEPPNGEWPNEAQARELARLLDKPEQMVRAWQEAVESAGAEGRPVTAADVRAAVAARMPRLAPQIAKPNSEQQAAPQRDKASANGKPATEQAQRAVEKQALTPDHSVAEPAPDRSPAEALEVFTARCGPVPPTIEAFDVTAAVQGRPQKVEEWRARCSAARDALDELIEQLGIEARKQTEATARAKRAGIGVR